MKSLNTLPILKCTTQRVAKTRWRYKKNARQVGEWHFNVQFIFTSNDNNNKSHIPNRKINTWNCTCIIQNKRSVSTIIIHHRFELCSTNLRKWIYLCAEIQVHQLYESNDSYELIRPLPHINTAHTLSVLNEMQFLPVVRVEWLVRLVQVDKAPSTY